MSSVRPGAARGRRPLARLAVVGCLAAALTAPGTAALADPGGAARARAEADAAAQQVDALQARVDAALASYRTAMAGLAGVVTRSIGTQRQAEAAAADAARAAAAQTRRIRALYMSGGGLLVLDSLLSARSPADVADQMHWMDSVVLAGQVGSDALGAAASRAAHRASAADRAATRRIATVQDVQLQFEDLSRLLAAQQAVLDRLDARARSLAAAERAAAQVAAARAAAANAAMSSARRATAGGIPADFLALYRSAATGCPGLSWTVLAAIGQVESGHGTNNGPSSAGAEGPMQFLPSTFAAYAVDGNGDGVADIWNPADAIATASAYLCANGAGRGPRGLHYAVLRYNHAEWYYVMVMRIADEIAARYGVPAPVSA